MGVVSHMCMEACNYKSPERMVRCADGILSGLSAEAEVHIGYSGWSQKAHHRLPVHVGLLIYRCQTL